MADMAGIQGEGSSMQPIEPSSIGGTQGVSGSSDQSVANIIHAPIKTLGQLKQVLISSLGEEQGTRFYNNLIKSFVVEMVSQVQKFAAHTHDAAKSMPP